MTKRLPPKGTREFQHYWRDRSMLDDFRMFLSNLRFVAANTEAHRIADFKSALDAVEVAQHLFASGHRKPYIIGSGADK